MVPVRGIQDISRRKSCRKCMILQEAEKEANMFVDIAIKAVGIQFVYALVVLGVDWIVHKKMKNKESKGGTV